MASGGMKVSAHGVIRLGLIGVGKHGARYARHIRDDLPQVTLAAVARRDAERVAAAAREFGARPYTDWRALIAAGGVDAIVAVVPPTLHLDIAGAAAEAGLPLLLEKPVAPNLQVGRAIAEVAAAIPVMVAQTLRYNAVVRALLAEVPILGRVHSLNFTQRFEPTKLGWLDDPAISGGGMILHTGVHAFDLVRLFTGAEVERVSCQAAAVHTERTEDSFAATLSLRGGRALATVACTRTAGARNGHIEVAGECGTLLGDHVLNRAELLVGGGMQSLDVGPSVFTVREVLQDFVGALRTGRPMPIPLPEGLRAVAIADACAVAVRSGQVVEVAR